MIENNLLLLDSEYFLALSIAGSPQFIHQCCILTDFVREPSPHRAFAPVLGAELRGKLGFGLGL